MYRLNIGKEKAWQKIKHYCAYQERSHKEVKEKLYGFGLYKADVEMLLTQLIEENYLNEERFALAFAGGKFRMKQWGRQKIKYELKQKQVSDYCIKKALAAIDGEQYEKVLYKMATGKLNALKTEKNLLLKKRKLQQYLMQKGFETAIITKVIDELF
ncbi:MAG TPA: regulatory protein RecX [Ferruginibacter sp.]|jgi:regulatory protein|nr:RecX family transcriptional regulator [Bacteroidota bacterium]MBS1926410.1 RecX family transcriptional regulator [Bacteroidota bacterium]MCC6693469.1 RecX family transcriptional regulator [Chitinophagaceae bacterium]HMT96603.1 regulatory protein RecX [Ferruginibacter sp.]HMU24542.1 regulatory protein RecX [Ferruginibacter sp.]